MKAKVIRLWFVALVVFLSLPARAQTVDASENRFDALAKSIAPIIALLTPAGHAGNHALDAEAIIAAVSGLPAEMSGARVHVAFEFPDKLLVQFPTAATTATICRDRQTVWAFPAAQFSPLVEKVGVDISTTPLPPFQIDETKAVLLPALFDVHDAGFVQLNNQGYRVLDVRLVRQSKTKKRTAGWPVRLWIQPQDHRVAQIELRSSDWSATLAIEKLDLAPTLPAAIWQPTPEQHDQIMAVPGDKMGSLLELSLKRNK